MRRYLAIILAILISLTLVACEGTPALPDSSVAPSASPDTVISPEPTSEGRERTAFDNEQRAILFRDFLSNNYNKLSEQMPGGIAGVGFIDLDCDGGMEMLLFDAGASASMGLQFFDVVDGEVKCVSANIFSIRESFGIDDITDVYVNANFFEDFRLMSDTETGEKFFCVTSTNGAIDFSYFEQIRFGADGETLTLTSLFYKHEDCDEDTGKVLASNFTVNGEPCDEARYNEVKKAFEDSSKDLLLEAAGVFAWEDSSYTEGPEGLLAMADKALSLAGEQKDLF